MRKIFIFLLLIILLKQVFAQNYKTVIPGDTTYFNGGTAVIQLDSITNSGDTVMYHNFKMIRANDDFATYDLQGASWTGKNIMVLPNGINMFVNKESDTIFIKTNAELGEKWLFYTYSNGNYIEAEIASKTEEDFIGINDWVKTITLQLKTSDGTNVCGFINDKYLKISENYGFVRAFNFYEFPFDTNTGEEWVELPAELELAGTSGLGYTNFGAAEIYNYDVGDEMHIKELQYGDDVTPAEKKQIIYKVISVLKSDNEANYSFDRCYSYEYSDYQNPENSYIEYVHDTIDVNYDFTSAQMQQLGNLSYKPFFDGGFWTFMTGKSRCTYAFTGDDIHHLSEVLFDPVYCNNYCKGLGGPYYIRPEFSLPPAERVLVYYKKGSVEWGTPYSCEQLSVSKFYKKSKFVKISPNPANTYIYLSSENYVCKNQKILITDISGKIYYRKTGKILNSKIDISNFPSGIYILRISNNDFIETQKIVIQHK